MTIACPTADPTSPGDTQEDSEATHAPLPFCDQGKTEKRLPVHLTTLPAASKDGASGCPLCSNEKRVRWTRVVSDAVQTVTSGTPSCVGLARNPPCLASEIRLRDKREDRGYHPVSAALSWLNHSRITSVQRTNPGTFWRSAGEPPRLHLKSLSHELQYARSS